MHLEIDAYSLALIAGGFTVIGALIGVVTAFWLSIHLERIKERRSSCVVFRAAFAPSIAHIAAYARHSADDHDKPDVSKFLREEFVSHATAIEIFRPFVMCDARERYQEAWESYCELEPTLWAGAMFMAEGINPQEPHQAVLEKINAILAFAEI